MTLFTIKYMPKNSSQVFGQQLAVSQVKDFIQNYKKQKYKAALLHGPIGNGKTSSVHALAKELKYDILEINSSDVRNEEAMKTFLSSALGQQSLFFTPKVVLIDEIDNISGVADRGCISALLKAVEKSLFPVILTANDLSDSKFKPLQKACLGIEFHPLQYRTIAHGLGWVCEQEGIKTDEKALNTLARMADGDMRAALIDLQICAGNGALTVDSLSALSDRKRKETIVNALRLIFKSSTVENALPALDNVNMDMEDVFHWLDANLPLEYIDATSLAKAYEWLSKADVFQGRIRRWQHWRFLAYINELLTAGISSAKEQKNTQFVEYRPTMRFLRMWQAKMKYGKKKEVAVKLARRTHTSSRVAMKQIPYLQMMFRKGKGNGIARELELSEEEGEWMRT